MSLELTDPSKSYELVHPSGAIFIMRHWTNAMQEEIDRRCIISDGRGGLSYLSALEREIKIDLACQNWRGVTREGEEVLCNSETKKMLPPGAVLWIVKDVDERAGIRMPDTEKKS